MGDALGEAIMFSSTFRVVVLTSSLACLITTIGILVISRYEKWGTDNTVYFMSFAAGVLISVSFIHIIPKSIEMNASAPIYLLAGFLALYLFNRFLNAYVCHEYECPDLSLGIIPMLGVGLHSFLDGVIYSVTFNVSIFTGILAAIGMVLHEFPEGIVTFLLLELRPYRHRWEPWFPFPLLRKSSARPWAPC
jgi:zinc transporter ZupT